MTENAMIQKEEKMDNVPEFKSTVGNLVRFSNPEKTMKYTAKVIDDVWIICYYPEENAYFSKLIQVLEQPNKRYSYRFGYYYYREKPRKGAKKGGWIWGQYAKIIGIAEWKKLYKLAEDKGFFSKYGGVGQTPYSIIF